MNLQTSNQITIPGQKRINFYQVIWSKCWAAQCKSGTNTGRVATVREKYLEIEILFQVREMSGNFVDGQGNLEWLGKSGKSQGIWK